MSSAGQIDSLTANDQAREILRVTGLIKRFGTTTVLNGVSFALRQGQVLAVLGRSGSGKSTLLRCINFLEEWDEGEIFLDGSPIGYRVSNKGGRTRQSESEISRTRLTIGMVFQSFNLFPHLNVLDNITLAPIRITGTAPEEARTFAKELLARVGLSGKETQFPSRLSGGQQQRVAIARALALRPKVMLFDEVTSALDPELVGEVLGVMRQLALDGMTMIIVTHEMYFARDVADRIMFLDQGRIAEEGSPKCLFESPQTESLRVFLRRFTKEYFL